MSADCVRGSKKLATEATKDTEGKNPFSLLLSVLSVISVANVFLSAPIRGPFFLPLSKKSSQRNDSHDGSFVPSWPRCKIAARGPPGTSESRLRRNACLV